MKRIKYIVPFVLAITLLLGIDASCKNKNPNNTQSPCESNPGSCKSVLEAKDFFVFNVGSFWVYEEETSHERDSLFVIQYSNDENGYDFYLRIQSSLTDYVYTYWPTYTGNVSGCNQNGAVTRKCLYVNRAKGKFQDNLGETIVFFVNYNLGDSLYSIGDMNYCPNSMIRVKEINHDFQVGNNTFQNVVKIQETCSFQEGEQPANIFYAKNIGIVRKELIDSNQVWNLINYQVIQ